MWKLIFYGFHYALAAIQDYHLAELFSWQAYILVIFSLCLLQSVLFLCLYSLLDLFCEIILTWFHHPFLFLFLIVESICFVKWRTTKRK